jgi:hypothetical protein
MHAALGTLAPTQEVANMEGRDVAAAVMTVVLVAAGVIPATVIMNRFGDLLSLVDAPGTRPSEA